MSERPSEVISSDPAAGGAITWTAPSACIVNSVYFTMTTDATVANRVVQLVADDGVDIFWRTRGATNHPASSSRTYCAFPGASVGENGMVNLALPTNGLFLRAGDRLFTAVQSGAAGDDYSAMTLNVTFV